jgi:prepilin-type N-terminal cleavage/methylation domain-containing protein
MLFIAAWTDRGVPTARALRRIRGAAALTPRVMCCVRAPAARLHRSEAGFTLIELLLVAAILPVVLFAILAPLDQAGSLTPQDVEYTHAAQDASIGLRSMLREIRQAYNVAATTPNSITFNVVLNGNDQQVMYGCNQPSPTAAGYRSCLRVSVATGGTLPAISSGQLVVDRLINGTSTDPVFNYTPSPITPTYVEAQVKVPARGTRASGLSHTITFDDGTLLRNEAIGG